MPLHLPHHIFFVAANDDSIKSYARSFFTSDPDFAAMPEHLESADHLPPVKLPLVEREALLARLPAAAVENLLAEERWVLGSVARQWHVPPGERVVSSFASVLSEPFEDCPPGTVVVVRETDRATLGYVLPHLRVDLMTGATMQTAPPPVAMPVTARRSVHAAGSISGGELAQIALQFSATLSFALPPPFGPVVAGFLGLLEALVPRDKVDLAGKVADAIEKAQKRRDLGAWMTNSASLVKWCQERIDVMAGQPPNVPGVEPTPLQIADTLLPDLEKNLSPGGTSLYDTLEQIASEDYIKEPEALNALLLCVSAYLFGMRFKLTLEAYIAAKADKDSETFNEWNRRWRFDYVLFHDAILGGRSTQGWAPRLGQIIEGRISARLGQISDVFRGSRTEKGGFCQGGSGQCNTTRINYWAFEDKALDPWSYEHEFDDEDRKEDGYVERRAEAEQARKVHVEGVTKGLDELYGDARKTVKTWVDSINQWNDHLPPNQPPNTIEVDGFMVTDPPEGPWKGVQRVQYAVVFANDKPSPRSDWSQEYEVNGQGNAKLVKIPVDGLGMATQRTIWRRFDGGRPVPVLLIADNTTTTAVDDKH